MSHPEPERLRGAIDRAVGWTVGMQCKDGGWGAFDADNTRELAYKLPFCDFGAVIDPPSADVTAHIVEMMAAEGRCRRARPAGAAIAWLLAAQERGRLVVRAVGVQLRLRHRCGRTRPGRGRGQPAATRGSGGRCAGSRTSQSEDGGWGEDMRSYSDPAWSGRGTSTASQTAWALLALLAAGERTSAATERGVAWLVEHQRADGTWDEPEFTGTGFPGHFFINYHLYRLVFPVSALGRYVNGGDSG